MDTDKDLNEYQLLKELGLKQPEIECYQCLAVDGATYVSALSKKMGKKRTGMYGQLSKLHSLGLLTKFKADIGPTYYSAIKVEDALENQYLQRRKTLWPLIRRQRLKG